ncbi:MAG: hypothetical protein HZA14_03325 [Nitrospirae bacterium]|nr:hypothetical protein [Nitrospirota bacterium]
MIVSDLYVDVIIKIPSPLPPPYPPPTGGGGKRRGGFITGERVRERVNHRGRNV